ncbi:MAG: hypothetical protein C7B45_05620 [Sulfobacillus acidophilus]|uniref:Uncharacterized protein n=1 Tax=Sulfobacillus acidophilus TaxID=53633 RepID=A0A2T2WKP4_9FIRM|nr:MAG: hypothetical protein C7B45_05620 [Sulfobacillus acidophilus]
MIVSWLWHQPDGLRFAFGVRRTSVAYAKARMIGGEPQNVREPRCLPASAMTAVAPLMWIIFAKSDQAKA